MGSDLAPNAMGVAVIGAGLLGLWSFQHSDYADRPWWRVMADADAERAMRAWAGAALLLFVFGVWRLFASAATPPVVGESDPDFERVRAILAKAEFAEPSSNLALLGDKRFLFSASGESFLMFGVRRRAWVALGPPVGRRDRAAPRATPWPRRASPRPMPRRRALRARG